MSIAPYATTRRLSQAGIPWRAHSTRSSCYSKTAPPRHTRFRRLVNTTFTLKRIAELTPWITRVDHELLDEIGTAETDIVPSYTMPLPVKVIARVLGIPGEDYVTFKRWSDAFLAFTSMPPGDRAQHGQDMMGYFGRMAAARRAHGAEDLITTLVEAKVDGESLEDWEILGFCMLLLIAGNETTTHLIGNILNILVDRPALWQQLREDRRLVEPVIEETLRYESPVQRTPRETTPSRRGLRRADSRGGLRVDLLWGREP